MKTLGRSFGEIIELYDKEYSLAIDTYFDDDVELARICDGLRQKYLIPAMVLIETQKNCQCILSRLTKRNVDIREKVIIKMKEFPEVEMKQSC